MRLREIDFLRGVAVLLVIFRHSEFFPFFHKAGWMGVDLFFVLSGFLVSGLLFKEYLKYGNIKPFLFLIRRGFKIYPLFYFTICIAIILEFQVRGSWPRYYQIVSELFFLQSYIKGILGITWSLAIEEHFYFLIVFIVFLMSLSAAIRNSRLVLILCSIVFLICIVLRLSNILSFPFVDKTHVFPTHLRIDSLLFGVLISYFYNFKKELFFKIFSRHRSIYYSLAIVVIIMPFVFGIETVFMNSIGLTLLAIAFGVILALFMTDDSINEKLNRIFIQEKIVSFISLVGFYSYGIYLWHMMIKKYLMRYINDSFSLTKDGFIEFVIYFVLSIVAGIIFSRLIEHYFLKVRDQYFPKRGENIVMNLNL